MQIERQAIFGEQGIARLPLRIDGQVDRAIGPLRVGMPVDDMADALDARMRGLRGQQGVEIGIVQRGEGDGAGRQPLDPGQAIQPLRFAQRARSAR